MLFISFVSWSQLPLDWLLKWRLCPQLCNQMYSYVYQNIYAAHSIDYHNGIQNLRKNFKKMLFHCYLIYLAPSRNYIRHFSNPYPAKTLQHINQECPNFWTSGWNPVKWLFILFVLKCRNDWCYSFLTFEPVTETL